MNKALKRILLFFVLTVLLLTGIFSLSACKSKEVLDGDGMERKPSILSVSYEIHDGLQEGVYILAAKTNSETGKVTCDLYEQLDIKTDPTEANCESDLNLMFTLEEIINSYDILSWENLPASDNPNIEASYASVVIETADGEFHFVGDTLQLPENAGEAFGELVKTMLNELGVEE